MATDKFTRDTGKFTDYVVNFEDAEDAVIEWAIANTAKDLAPARRRSEIRRLKVSVRLDYQFGRELCRAYGARTPGDIDPDMFDLLVACRTAVAFQVKDLANKAEIAAARAAVVAVALAA